MTTPFDEDTHKRRSMFAGLRASFFTGLIVIAPVAFTIWLLWSFIGWVDGFVMPFVPANYHPEQLVNRWLDRTYGTDDWIHVNIRGVGVFVFFFFEVTLKILLPKGITEPLFFPLYNLFF